MLLSGFVAPAIFFINPNNLTLSELVVFWAAAVWKFGTDLKPAYKSITVGIHQNL
jgi:hypothetical protein